MSKEGINATLWEMYRHYIEATELTS
jgi:hypothetical protein